MCKYNKNLFVIGVLWLASIKMLLTSPVDLLLLEDLLADESNADYDLYYDQRQNGTENIRLRIDGVVVAIPSSSSSQTGSMVGNLASNYLLQLATATDDDDDDDTNNYFNFVKNANTADNGSSTIDKNSNFEGKIKVEGANKKDTKPDEKIKTVTLNKEIKEEYAKPSPEIVMRNSGNAEISAKDDAPGKIQMRGRNKFKLRLGGLLDFLKRSREQ